MQQTGFMSSEGAPLTEVIGLVKLELSKDKAIDKAAAKVKRKKGQTEAPDGVPVQPRSPQVQDGIDANKAFLKSLRDGVENDTGITGDDRRVLLKALDELGLNLGSDAVAKATEIVDAARYELFRQNLADKYLVPYLDRVKTQQAARIAKTAKAKAKKDDGPDQTPPTTPPQDNGPSGPTDTGGSSGVQGLDPQCWPNLNPSPPSLNSRSLPKHR